MMSCNYKGKSYGGGLQLLGTVGGFRLCQLGQSWIHDSQQETEHGGMSRQKRMLLPPNIVHLSMRISSSSSSLIGISVDKAPSFFSHPSDIAQRVVDLPFHLFYRFDAWRWVLRSSGK